MTNPRQISARIVAEKTIIEAARRTPFVARLNHAMAQRRSVA